MLGYMMPSLHKYRDYKLMLLLVFQPLHLRVCSEPPYPGHQNIPKALYGMVFGPKGLNI